MERPQVTGSGLHHLCRRPPRPPRGKTPLRATGAGDLKGLEQFCADRKVDRGYVITKDVNDFSVMPLVRAAAAARVVKIPAPLACYWLGLLEVEAAGRP